MNIQRYPVSMRVIHWLMALGFLFMWGSGWSMTSLVAEGSSLEELLFSLHISVGVSLLFLLLLRIYLRFSCQLPAPVTRFSKWENLAAHLGHMALYVLPATVMLVGWAEVDFGGHGVSWFGMAMPKLLPTMQTFAGIELEDFTEETHELLANLMFVLVLVHVAAVVKHRWFDGTDLLSRMWWGKSD